MSLIDERPDVNEKIHRIFIIAAQQFSARSAEAFSGAEVAVLLLNFGAVFQPFQDGADA